MKYLSAKSYKINLVLITSPLCLSSMNFNSSTTLPAPPLYEGSNSCYSQSKLSISLQGLSSSLLISTCLSNLSIYFLFDQKIGLWCRRREGLRIILLLHWLQYEFHLGFRSPFCILQRVDRLSSCRHYRRPPQPTLQTVKTRKMRIYQHYGIPHSC